MMLSVTLIIFFWHAYFYWEQCTEITGLYDENWTCGTHLKFTLQWLNAFVNVIISLFIFEKYGYFIQFYGIWGVSKGTRDNIITRVLENNVRANIYQHILILRGVLRYVHG